MSSIPPNRKAPPPDRPLNVGASGIRFPSPIKTQAPDWDFWRGMRKVLHWQACALSVGADPDTMGRRQHDSYWTDDAYHADQLPAAHAKIMTKRLRLLKANCYDREVFTLSMAQYSTLNTGEVLLSEFAAWGLSLGWDDMPQELSAMAQGRATALPASATLPTPDAPDGNTVSPTAPPLASKTQAAPANEPVTPAASMPEQTDDAGLSRREMQIRAIEAAAAAQGYDVVSIPTGGKKILMNQCRESNPELFGAGHDPFNDAWKKAIASTPPRLRMADHNKFAGK